VVEDMLPFPLRERALGEGGEQVGVRVLAGRPPGCLLAQAPTHDFGHVSHHSLPLL
jgi:hypothetical protein